ncbi:MAG TPA: protein-disulfide reductase DsbD domain-containing protein, partial [Verrucomicrobiae bacterium]|nr:protein-disulfide reductase DsbD domain-containing protein [Verrucomicrobiae bacterium]
MRSWLQIVGAILFMVAAATAQAAHTQASLLFGDETAPAGGTVLAGIRLRMDPGWHNYWKNSGASGIPTTIKWDLPEGISAGEIQWPIPEKFPPDDLVTYGYTNEVILLVPLTIAPGVKPGPVEAKAKVAWLECKEQCVPASAEVRAVLNVGAARKSSDQAALLAAWEQKTPRPSTNASARWERTITNDVRTILLECQPPVVSGHADFFPYASEDYEVEGATEKAPAAPGTMALRKRVKKFQG